MSLCTACYLRAVLGTNRQELQRLILDRRKVEKVAEEKLVGSQAEIQADNEVAQREAVRQGSLRARPR